MDLVSPHIARDYIYVEDMVDAYLKIEALKKNGGEYFNIGTGIQSTIKEVVDMAVLVTNKKARFNWKKMKARAWDTDTWVADITKAKMKLGWRPKTSLADGLKLTFDWFSKNKNI